MQTKADMVLASSESRLGDPYVFGAWGEECTPANRRKRIRSDHPTIVSKCQVLSDKTGTKSCNGCPYQGRHIYDCRGFTYRCLLDAGIKISGDGATSQYDNKSNWVERGTTDNMPNCVCCIFQDNGTGTKKHTGLHLGNGKIRHCSGEVKEGTIDKSWTHYAVPVGLYDAVPEERLVVMSVLKNGSKGDNVLELQTNLKALGYNPGPIDGKFGNNTESAVRRFQADHGLTVDGKAGSVTRTAIADCLAALSAQSQTANEPAEKTVEQRLNALEEFANEVRKRLFPAEG